MSKSARTPKVSEPKKPRGAVTVISKFEPDEERMLDGLMLALGLSPWLFEPEETEEPDDPTGI